MGENLKTASFTVHATVEQSEGWKRAAEAKGPTGRPVRGLPPPRTPT